MRRVCHLHHAVPRPLQSSGRGFDQCCGNCDGLRVVVGTSTVVLRHFPACGKKLSPEACGGQAGLSDTGDDQVGD